MQTHSAATSCVRGLAGRAQQAAKGNKVNALDSQQRPF